MRPETEFDRLDAPSLGPDFAERVVRRARIERQQRRVRRRALASLCLVLGLTAGAAWFVQGPRAHPRQDGATFAALDGEEGAISAERILVVLEETSDSPGDDPAGYFFPDSEAVAASD